MGQKYQRALSIILLLQINSKKRLNRIQNTLILYLNHRIDSDILSIRIISHPNIAKKKLFNPLREKEMEAVKRRKLDMINLQFFLRQKCQSLTMLIWEDPVNIQLNLKKDVVLGHQRLLRLREILVKATDNTCWSTRK